MYKLLLLIALFQIVSSYKILVYNPRIAHSHSTYFGRIADILVDKGHNVTSLIPIINDKISDGTTKSKIIHFPGHPVSKKTVEDVDNAEFDMLSISIGSLIGEYQVQPLLTNFFALTCGLLIKDDELLNRLKDEHFDVVIAEPLDFCGVGLSRVISAKSLIVLFTQSIFDTVAEWIGISRPINVPCESCPSIDISSMYDRFMNAHITQLPDPLCRTVLCILNKAFKEKFGETFPDMQELVVNSSFIFTNTNPLFDFARPTLRKIVHLGGLGVDQPKPLDDYWLEVLSRRNHTVLVSFGSIVPSHTLKLHHKEAMLQTFAVFPDVTFIWKYEKINDDFASNRVSKVDNVVLSKWIPQSDILADPRVIGFFSHGGISSCHESATRGVPMLIMPVFSDQPRNAAVMENAGMGLTLNKNDLGDEKKLFEAVHRLINDESLLHQARRISRMLSKPLTPLEDVMTWHVEFAAEHGSHQVLNLEKDISTVQKFNLDIKFIAISALSILVIVIFKLISCVVSLKIKVE